jgi:hypothetical protein
VGGLPGHEPLGVRAVKEGDASSDPDPLGE